ncbi:MAG TPA: response regulator [Chthonomonadaceae bacterium]|nr:response regulator [Chthonomonadaceae bacterium]
MLLGKRVVLCVESGIEAMRLRYDLLQAGLYVIGSAAKGRDAVDVVLESNPDIVLMDVDLQEMNGLEAAQRLLAHGRFCIVMIAEDSQEMMEQKARQIGVSDYLVQPVTRETLLSRLEAAWETFERKNQSEVTNTEKVA